jgi:hypothetical protein
MADPAIRIDPVGMIALANVLRFYGNPECSCELKCVCDNQCSCEMKCVSECSCELKCVSEEKDGTNILDLMSNPVFREVVKGLDVNRLKSIEDFMGIVDEIRTKMNAAQPRPDSPEAARS